MQKLPFVSYMPSINNKGTCQPFVLAHRASIGEFRVAVFMSVSTALPHEGMKMSTSGSRLLVSAVIFKERWYLDRKNEGKWDFHADSVSSFNKYTNIPYKVYFF